MEKTKELCDDLPTSLAYMDTSVNPNKFIGHVLVEKCDEEIKSLELGLNEFFFANFALQSTM